MEVSFFFFSFDFPDIIQTPQYNVSAQWSQEIVQGRAVKQ
jgi:hypothetical protein